MLPLLAVTVAAVVAIPCRKRVLWTKKDIMPLSHMENSGTSVKSIGPLLEHSGPVTVEAVWRCVTVRLWLSQPVFYNCL